MDDKSRPIVDLLLDSPSLCSIHFRPPGAVHSLKLRWHVAGCESDLAFLSFASTLLPFTFEPQTLSTSIPSALALIITATLVGKGLVQEVEHDLRVAHDANEKRVGRIPSDLRRTPSWVSSLMRSQAAWSA